MITLFCIKIKAFSYFFYVLFFSHPFFLLFTLGLPLVFFVFCFLLNPSNLSLMAKAKFSQPNIYYVVNKIYQFIHSPYMSHWSASSEYFAIYNILLIMSSWYSEILSTCLLSPTLIGYADFLGPNLVCWKAENNCMIIYRVRIQRHG